MFYDETKHVNIYLKSYQLIFQHDYKLSKRVITLVLHRKMMYLVLFLD